MPPINDNGWKEIIKNHTEEIAALREQQAVDVSALRIEHITTDAKIDAIGLKLEGFKGRVVGYAMAASLFISIAMFAVSNILK